ncbi:hypothetical protein [Vibrio mangrovi]|uniref:B12 binding domain protein n=1 Tax=Vibrio mangrovi TaxID=474394 RepID=A0A1Y6IWV7_9VIBR|nr:hypothetical protein [Vibrio mangrovi]MDW6005411.1 hypothetical protein [Vibrio mangrovi]SMS02149.1 hypothetical protein VIM7927_03467 [Vibrio mangrovi]
MKNKMTVLNLLLPQWNPLQVFPVLPMFKGYFTHHGLEVKTLDANVRFYHWLLSKDFLKILENHVSHTMMTNAVTRLQCEAAEHIQTVISEPEQTFDPIFNLRKQEVFEDERQRNHALEIWENYLTSVSIFFPPMHLSYRGLKFELPKNPEAIRNYCQNEEENLFRLYYTHVLFDQVQNLKPDFITLSIISNEQLLPSLIFCHLIKRLLPDIHLCVGAPLLVEYLKLGHGFEQLLPDELDSLVIGHHFEPFLALIQALEQGKPVPEHPYLLRNIKQEQHKVMEWKPILPESGYPKDYSDINLSDYFHFSPLGTVNSHMS